MDSGAFVHFSTDKFRSTKDSVGLLSISNKTRAWHRLYLSLLLDPQIVTLSICPCAGHPAQVVVYFAWRLAVQTLSAPACLVGHEARATLRPFLEIYAAACFAPASSHVLLSIYQVKSDRSTRFESEMRTPTGFLRSNRSS